MTLQTHTGSCHCGNVRFEADIDLNAPTGQCNCSICTKTRNWSASVKPENFRLLTDPDATGDYHFGTHAVHWRFCKTCGVRPYADGDIAEIGGRFVSVQLACLDDVTPQQLAALKVRYADGRANNWTHPPAETSYL